MNPERDRTTRLLALASSGDRRAADQYLPLVYDELRRLAQSFLGSRARSPLQATALVHEAYLKLVDQEKVDWQCRTHFLRVAAQQMRRVLVDHAREQGAQKRGGNLQRVTLGDRAQGDSIEPVELLALEEALQKLARVGERQHRVVELRFFAGLSNEETAQVLGLAERTVKEDWTFARAWLDRELSGGARA